MALRPLFYDGHHCFSFGKSFVSLATCRTVTNLIGLLDCDTALLITFANTVYGLFTTRIREMNPTFHAAFRISRCKNHDRTETPSSQWHTCITVRNNNLPSLSICYISPPTLHTELLQWVPGQTGTSWTSRQFIIGASLWPLIIFSPLRDGIWEPSCKTHARMWPATPFTSIAWGCFIRCPPMWAHHGVFLPVGVPFLRLYPIFSGGKVSGV